MTGRHALPHRGCAAPCRPSAGKRIPQADGESIGVNWRPARFGPVVGWCAPGDGTGGTAIELFDVQVVRVAITVDSCDLSSRSHRRRGRGVRELTVPLRGMPRATAPHVAGAHVGRGEKHRVHGRRRSGRAAPRLGSARWARRRVRRLLGAVRRFVRLLLPGRLPRRPGRKGAGRDQLFRDCWDSCIGGPANGFLDRAGGPTRRRRRPPRGPRRWT